MDVLIVGGGAAGQTLARHLRREAPDLSVAIVDRDTLPRPSESLRLGESTSEVGAGYLLHRLGLGRHLREVHHAKAGLRFFFRRGEGDAFVDRAEYGGNTPLAGIWTVPFDETNPPTFQLHRGRLEAHLVDENRALGVAVLDGGSVREVVIGEPHTVRIERGGEPTTLHARWVVDASARAGIVRSQFTEFAPTGHAIRASFGWVRARLDPDAFSADPSFRARCPWGVRWRGTTHLMGDGYWIWIIAHPDALTSIGLVTTADAPHPEDLPAFLAEREPELWAQIEAGGGLVEAQTGRFEAGCVRELVDARRLAVVGDAAATADALYSPGLDLIAVSNELVAACILADHRGGDVARQQRYANVLFPQLHRQYMLLYRDLYTLTATPRVLAAKIAWDNAVYFAFTAPWLRSPDFAEPAGFGFFGPLSRRVADLHARMQDLFAAWAAAVPAVPVHGVFDQNQAEFLMDPLRGVQALRSGPELRDHLAAQLPGLEALAVAMFRQAAVDLDLDVPAGPLNAYAVGLDPKCWQDDGLAVGRMRREPAPTEGLWLSP